MCQFQNNISKFKFSRVKLNIFVTYVPTEGDVEKGERVRNDLERVVDRVSNRHRLCDGTPEWIFQRQDDIRYN